MRFKKTTVLGTVALLAVIAGTVTVFATAQTPEEPQALLFPEENDEVIGFAIETTEPEMSVVTEVTESELKCYVEWEEWENHEGVVFEWEHEGVVFKREHEHEGVVFKWEHEGVVFKMVGEALPTPISDFRPPTPDEIELAREQWVMQPAGLITDVIIHDEHGNRVWQYQDGYGNITDRYGNVLRTRPDMTVDENGNAVWLPADSDVEIADNMWWEWNGSEWDFVVDGVVSHMNWVRVNDGWKEMEVN